MSLMRSLLYIANHLKLKLFLLSPFTQPSSKAPQEHHAELNLKVLDYVSSLKILQNTAVKCSGDTVTWHFWCYIDQFPFQT